MTFRESTSLRTQPDVPAEDPLPTIRILGSRVDNLDYTSALERVFTFASRDVTTGARRVFFTNVHTIVVARRDSALDDHLEHADLVLPDGSGLQLAGKAFRTPIAANLNGTDFSPKLLKYAAERNLTVYLLGARPAVLDTCISKLREQFAGLKIVGAHAGFFAPEEEDAIISDINEKQPNIVFVALGTPLQERWASRCAPHLRAGVCVAVGGLFDFISGHRKRAPQWMRTAGLEWMYRFFQDPRGKWSRVFVETPLFLGLVMANLVRPQARPDTSSRP